MGASASFNRYPEPCPTQPCVDRPATQEQPSLASAEIGWVRFRNSTDPFRLVPDTEMGGGQACRRPYPRRVATRGLDVGYIPYRTGGGSNRAEVASLPRPLAIPARHPSLSELLPSSGSPPGFMPILTIPAVMLAVMLLVVVSREAEPPRLPSSHVSSAESTTGVEGGLMLRFADNPIAPSSMVSCTGRS